MRAHAFPTLFVRMVRMGETVGSLDKVLKRLADYYDFVRAVWRRLYLSPRLSRRAVLRRRALSWLFMTYFLGIVDRNVGPEADSGFQRDDDPGRGDAPVFPAHRRVLCGHADDIGKLRATHELMVRTPVLGVVFRTLALARFSWSMELMTDAGVNILNAIQWSLQATANGAFEGRGEAIAQRIKDGMPLARGLEMSGLFPSDYVEMVHVAEESGNMPEMFARLAKNYFEKADDALIALSTAFSWFIRICVGPRSSSTSCSDSSCWYIGLLNATAAGG